MGGPEMLFFSSYLLMKFLAGPPGGFSMCQKWH